MMKSGFVCAPARARVCVFEICLAGFRFCVCARVSAWWWWLIVGTRLRYSCPPPPPTTANSTTTTTTNSSLLLGGRRRAFVSAHARTSQVCLARDCLLGVIDS